VSEQSYKEADDALRVKVASVALPNAMQSFGIGFSDITDSTANMYFAWEKTRVPVKIGVETTAIVETAIDKAAETSAANMNAGANYLLSKGKNLTKALSMVNQAVGFKETFRNLWTKAQILSKLGNFAEALPVAQKAFDLGSASNDPSFAFVKDAITKGLDEYKSKIPAIVPAVLPTKAKKK
jgi:tetratricopeptide (TPR) repeat protein